MAATLGQRLRTLRTERGLSQADLAGDLVSPSYVSLIESGKRMPEHGVLDGLAGRLGVSALYLESGISPEQMADERLRLQFAEIALANGSVAEARQQFSALTGAVAAEIRRAADWGLARVEEARGNLAGAVASIDRLLDNPGSADCDGVPGLLVLLNSRCRLYRKAGELTRGIEAGEQALRAASALGLEETEDAIKLATTLVDTYRLRGDAFSAQHLANQVIARAERLGSRCARGRANWNACIVAAERGELPLALGLAARTLALLAESSQERDLARVRVTYAWLLLQLDPPPLDEADALLASAHRVLSENSLGQDLACCETEMARSALLKGDFTDAIGIAELAIGRCEKARRAEAETARAVRGLALVLSGEREAGTAAVLAATGRLAELGSRAQAARYCRELADALLLLGSPEGAVAALRRVTDCVGVRSGLAAGMAGR